MNRRNHFLVQDLVALATLAITCSVMGCAGGGVDTGDAGLDDGGTVTTCAALAADGSCPAHRVCEDAESGATCLDACEAGFELEPVSGTCNELPSCDPASSESIVTSCDAEHRTCLEASDGARCGDCAAGFRPSPGTGACVVDDCGGQICGEDEVESFDGDVCSCVPRPCAADEALSRLSGFCVSCNLRCNAAGEAGLAPETDADGNCACDTTPGFFWPGGDAAQARRCDEDGDQWMNRSAFDAYQSSDATIARIARQGCEPFEVEGVVLRNEYAQELWVWSCDVGLRTTAADATSPCASSNPMPMVEPDRNDSQQKLALADAEVPDVVTLFGGRAARAEELNALTKLCVNEMADFDGVGGPDLAQVQGSGLGSAVSRWSAFTHFAELHRVEAPAQHVGGWVTIGERSRCAIGAGFPLEYAGVDPDSYAFECARQRDQRYDAAFPETGFDFARFSCDLTSGACPVPAPASLAPGATSTREHGLCSDPLQEWGETFRGMHHHSQFKCVQLRSAPVLGYEHALSTAVPGNPGSYLDFQRCHLRDSASAFDCNLFPAAADAVGWGAVRYEPEVLVSVAGAGSLPISEVAGCVDEADFEGLCPASTPVDEAGEFYQFGDASDFGALICGCPDTERRFYRDSDEDGHGDPADFVSTCLAPSGFVELGDDCAPNNATISPSRSDAPDAGAIDANCDGIDGDRLDSVFVSRLFGNDAATGLTPDSAMASIQAAIARAVAVGRHYVLISAGDFDVFHTTGQGVFVPRVTLASGVNVFGGYVDDHTFGARQANPDDTVITGVDGTPLVARAITDPTIVGDVTIRGPDFGSAGNSQASIAVAVIDSPVEGALAFPRTRIEARAAGDGNDGSVGGTAATGFGGGGGGRSRSCGDGGSEVGEAGVRPPNPTPTEVDNGRGGAAGNDDCSGSSCSSNCTSGTAGSSGANGRTPAGVAVGSTEVFGALIVDAAGLTWSPVNGTDGFAGGAGAGGGGGGSGGTWSDGCGHPERRGGRGGNGGAGGRGGAGGTVGAQGGASIALVLWRSVADLSGTVIVRGAGGDGGAGGNGADGGDGVQGECGADGPSESGNGGSAGGGGGGSGGTGGAGGNGGPSIGIVVHEPPATIPFLGTPAHENTGAAGVPGAGGTGGAHGRRRQASCSASFDTRPAPAASGPNGLPSLGASTQEL